ncbi:MAG: hypothetical protein Ct9H300mP13_7170 [Gammaproteobacteria bacterium]|nr:MAG: hypothetical protein Ct9H300mP13_7170 [Gammaproteobacteria bacterium]
MALHFDQSVFKQRCQHLQVALKREHLDGILLFKQESMFYLTGYDTFGFCFFQCLFVAADGRQVLLTRAPDLRQAQHTSTLSDIRVWKDDKGVSPAGLLRDVLSDYGCQGQRLGIELESYGLTGRSWDSVREVMTGFCQLSDHSEMVGRLRMVKDEAELSYVGRAAELADDALDAAIDVTRSGVDEGPDFISNARVVFAGGGDYPGNEFIIGSGRDALLCRYHSGRRVLDSRDQLTLEFAGVYRHYHACLMRTIVIGDPSPLQIAMHEACADAMTACVDVVRPGQNLWGRFLIPTPAFSIKPGFGSSYECLWL